MPTATSLPVEQLTEVHHPHMLKPLIDPVISTLINKFPGRLADLVKQHGSPLNLVWPHAFELNTQALLAVLKRYNVPYAIFYGAKANKSQSMLGAAANWGSASMCRASTSCKRRCEPVHPPPKSAPPDRPKLPVFHQALVSAGSLICVDSLEEFDHLQSTVEARPPSPKPGFYCVTGPKAVHRVASA